MSQRTANRSVTTGAPRRSFLRELDGNGLLHGRIHLGAAAALAARLPAFMVMLERLSPIERVVRILHIRDGRICTIYPVGNPDNLHALMEAE